MRQCPGCRGWNTSVEEPAGRRESASGRKTPLVKVKPSRIEGVNIEEQDRIRTGYPRPDRVLGNGIVAGSLMLMGGNPGIGKSTLLLQVCRNLATQGQKVSYISGRESLKQIKLRANRIGEITGALLFLHETNLDVTQGTVEEEKPDVVVTDSIQTMFRDEVSSTPGSVNQVRESTNLLMQIAKGQGIAISIVGHVTKKDVVVGPRVLGHMVGTVLYFEGERNTSYRVLRGVKGQLGSINEIDMFEMRETGLVEVASPSEYILNGRPKGTSEAVVACSLERTGSILLEVQALVTQTNFGIPRWTAAGTDYNRANLLTAMLERRYHPRMSRYDAYVNVADGMKMSEPAPDLAIAMTLVSSLKDRPVDAKTITFGEVGLSDEVRAVSMADQRAYEAMKLGFDACVLPRINLDKMRKTDKIRLVGMEDIREAITLL